MLGLVDTILTPAELLSKYCASSSSIALAKPLNIASTGLPILTLDMTSPLFITLDGLARGGNEVPLCIMCASDAFYLVSERECRPAIETDWCKEAADCFEVYQLALNYRLDIT